jgi:hypothetical protein
VGFWVRRVAVLAVALLAAGAAPAEDELAARVEQAEKAARANAESPEGREWMRRHSAAVDRLMIPLLNQCLPDPPGDIPTVFAVYVRLSQGGRVLEVVTELDAGVSRCMTVAGREPWFPEAPRDDYWIRVNMAAPL